jgi:hypothetical protein
MSGVGLIVAVPYVPIAIISASIAAMTYIIAKMVEFNRKADLVAGGYAPGSILAPGQTVFGETSDLLKWVIIGGTLYFALPVILKRLK